MISLQPQQTSKNNKEILHTTSLQTARLVKNVPAMQETWFDSWVGKIPWRRDRLPTPVFLGFPCGSTGKESTCNVGDLGSIPGLRRSPGEEKGYWPREFHGLYSLWGHKESDTTERLSLHFTHKQLYTHKFDSIDEMDQFLQKHKLLQGTQHGIDHLNRPVTIKEIKFPGTDDFTTEFYQTLKN